MATRPPAASAQKKQPPRVVRAISDRYFWFIDRTRTGLRAVGLGILTYVSKERPEPPKVLIDRSRRLALSRSLIHVLPAAISTFLVVFNLHGFFIGLELQGQEGQDDLKMGTLQICAKLQELLIVASLGSIVLHMIRSELVFGSGLPLGLIVSGWKFTDVSYFWSADFLGAVFLPQQEPQQRWRRMGLVTIILVSGLIAVTAGPASAVLMIPRRMEYSIGGSIFWLSGSEKELWPTTLSADNFRGCPPEQIFLNWGCPGFGFASLSDHYSKWWNRMNRQQDRAYDFHVNDGFIRKVMYVHPAAVGDRDSWVYTAHAASALIEDALSSTHKQSVTYLQMKKPFQEPWPRNLANAEIHAYELDTKVPAVRTICLPQGRFDLNSSQLNLRFVDVPETEIVGWPVDYDQPGYTVRRPAREIDVLETVRTALSLRDILGANDTQLDEKTVFANGQRRIVAVPVPLPEPGIGSSLGLVLFINHLVPEYNTNINTVTCTIDARWAEAKSIFKSNPPSSLLEHDFLHGRVRNPVMVALEHKTVREFLHSYWPAEPGVGLTRIRLEPSWYNLFSPVVPVDPTKPPGAASVVNTNQTALERILDVSHNDDRLYIPEIQHVVSSAIADGLSRCGVIPNRQITQNLGPLNWNEQHTETEQLARAMVRRGEPKLTHEMPEGLRQGNTTRIVMRAKFTGFAMVADAWFDYFCMVVLLTHATIALGHTIFVCLRRETGDAWDTILEFVALAHKSPPPPDPVLSNTCAGVTSFKTIGAVAWVEPVDPGDDGGDQLQLRFRNETNKERISKVETGAKYNGPRLGGTAGQI